MAVLLQLGARPVTRHADAAPAVVDHLKPRRAAPGAVLCFEGPAHPTGCPCVPAVAQGARALRGGPDPGTAPSDRKTRHRIHFHWHHARVPAGRTRAPRGLRAAGAHRTVSRPPQSDLDRRVDTPLQSTAAAGRSPDARMSGPERVDRRERPDAPLAPRLIAACWFGVPPLGAARRNAAYPMSAETRKPSANLPPRDHPRRRQMLRFPTSPQTAPRPERAGE